MVCESPKWKKWIPWSPTNWPPFGRPLLRMGVPWLLPGPGDSLDVLGKLVLGVDCLCPLSANLGGGLANQDRDK